MTGTSLLKSVSYQFLGNNRIYNSDVCLADIASILSYFYKKKFR